MGENDALSEQTNNTAHACHLSKGIRNVAKAESKEDFFDSWDS